VDEQVRSAQSALGQRSPLACIDASAAARPVLQTAAALGGTLTLPVVALHALAVARHTTKPLVVVPPVPRDPPPAGVHRVLVPLDGTASAAQAVQPATELFAGSGVEILALHVFDATRVPRFWDRPSTTTRRGPRSSWPAGARLRALAWRCGHPRGPHPQRRPGAAAALCGRCTTGGRAMTPAVGPPQTDRPSQLAG
jgi:hypothetical protein